MGDSEEHVMRDEEESRWMWFNYIIRETCWASDGDNKLTNLYNNLKMIPIFQLKAHIRDAHLKVLFESLIIIYF